LISPSNWGIYFCKHGVLGPAITNAAEIPEVNSTIASREFKSVLAIAEVCGVSHHFIRKIGIEQRLFT